MTLCKKPYPTIKDVLESMQPPRAFDYVSYRLYLDTPDTFTEKSDHIFAGCFATNKANEIIPLDGDTYSENEKVLAYEEWTDPNSNISNGLTLVVLCEPDEL